MRRQRNQLRERLERSRSPQNEVAPVAAIPPIELPPAVLSAPPAQIVESPPALIEPPPLPIAPLLRYEPKPPSKSTARVRQSGLEQMIGLKLAGWIGAIVLVIGAGLGIKFAYDQGWFGGLPPAWRLALMYAGGISLIGAGEYVYRKINRISATGLFGAGVATLFLVSYAGHAYYGLYQQQTAFTLMGLSTLVGAAVAMRGKLVSIAVLSLIGGTLAPLVLRGDQNLVVPFLSYLLALQVVALVLSWWGGSAKWWMLRGLSLASTSLWIAAAMLLHAQPWGAAMCFTLCYATLYQAEVILSARRRADSIEGGAGVAFTVIVTALLTGTLLVIFRHNPPAVRGIWVTALSAVTLATGVILRLRPHNAAIKTLAYGYRVQAAVLILIAVPVAFSGSAISIGWAGLAIALGIVGAKLIDRPTQATAIIAWALSLVNLFAWAVDPGHDVEAHATWLTILSQPLAAWVVLACAMAAVGHLLAWLQRKSSTDRDDATVARTLSTIATAVIGCVAIFALRPISATVTLLLYAWLLFGADIIVAGLALLPQSAALLLLAAVKWVVIDALAARLSPHWSAAQYRPVLNPLMGVGFAIAGSMIAMYRLRRDAMKRTIDVNRASSASAAIVLLAVVSILMTFGLSLEVDRVVEQIATFTWPMWQVKQLAWTTLWTLSLLACLVIFNIVEPANEQPRRRWRAGAITLAALLAAKFIVIDTLLWAMAKGPAHASPIVNLQTIAALIVAGALVGVNHLLRPASRDAGDAGDGLLRALFAATLVILWAGTLEIDRLVSSRLFPGALIWPTWQLKNFAWSAWWCAGAAGFLSFAQLRDATSIRRLPLMRPLTLIPTLLAIKYLVLDTLLFRLFKGPANATVGANLQTLAGTILFGGLVLVRYFLEEETDAASAKTKRAAGAMAVTMLLWLGTLEIDRAFHFFSPVTSLFADPSLAEQVALSIFWSIFAIALIATGFRFRTAGLRYFGLALFAFTLFKVGIVDLSQAALGYKVLSFFGLGGLLLGTSVLYGKLSPVLLREEATIGNDV